MGSKMSHEEVSTGMLYGFLKTIRFLSNEFGTERLAFCFDSATSKRKELYPAYKANRLKLNSDPVERAAKEVMVKQVRQLRTEYLPTLGYRNIFHQEGFEADDMVAAAAGEVMVDPVIAVSSDKDLYQLLNLLHVFRPAVGKTPAKLITAKTFRDEYGINPYQWIRVKALAGCSSDNIQGARGVGELTAIKYLRSELKSTTKAHMAIQVFKGSPAYATNKTLVKLPFPGTKPCPLLADERDWRAWNGLCKQLGLNSLRML